MSILIDADTTFIVQGITGREAVNLTRECLDYGAGAKIVGGVTPGRLGREVHGVPVFDTVAQAVAHHGAAIDGSVVTVPPAFTKDAVFEAIENGIKLVVIVTERIPRRDVAQMVELASLRGARIIGPNCLGIIVPDVIKMGGIGGPARNAAQAYAPGPVGVISRSGGMTTEMSSTLSAAGLGQSTAVSIGGDAIIGSTYAELMPLFEADEQTQGIVIYTEPGGRMEAELARWVTANDSRLPIVAFMAGRFMDEMPGMSFGHAGTIVEGKEDTASEKIERLAEAGIVVAEEISAILLLMMCGMSEMSSATVMPASARRAIFSVAVSSLPSTIVPAWPKLIPGISSMKRPAMNATIGSRESLSATQRASSASMRPPGSV